MQKQNVDVVVVGTGPAGLTAAIYAARANLKVLVCAGMQHGGQLTTTTEVENFPGFAEGILGPKLMQEMTAQCERFGAKVIYEEIEKVDFSSKAHRVWSDQSEIQAKAVIIATGATAKTLGLENEAKLMGKGVSTCATCDGFFYKGKKVAVAGGGDSAMEEATYLAKICSEVILIHRRDSFRASAIMLERAKRTPNIRFMTPFEVTELLYDNQGLKGIKVKENSSRGEVKSQDLTIDGFFMAIGHRPNSKVFLPFVDVNDLGYIKVKEFTKTKTPGVFAAGDIADPVFKQAITAAGMGCQAAMQAIKYIEAMEH